MEHLGSEMNHFICIDAPALWGYLIRKHTVSRTKNQPLLILTPQKVDSFSYWNETLHTLIFILAFPIITSPNRLKETPNF